MTDFNTWYEKQYPYLTGQGLWLRGGELNTLDSQEYECRSFRICFTRLSSPYDCAGSLTHKLLYQIASKIPGVFCDLAYLPPRYDLPLFELDQVPWILGTHTKRGPRDFDVIGFSNAIVQELLNLPAMLLKSGIPLSKNARLADAAIPLVILGGANAANTAFLRSADPLVDGIFVGECHDAIRQLLMVCRDAKEQKTAKKELLSRLETIDGFFQPDVIKPIAKARTPDLSKQKAPTQIPIMFIGDQAGAATLPISVGCPCFCSFCAESFQNKPYQEIKADIAIEHALEIIRKTGASRLDLFSFNFNMHSQIIPLLEQLSGYVSKIGLKSQRFDYIARDNQWLRLLHVLGKTSITCGLEGISARLRKYLNKNLDEKDVRESLSRLCASPLRELKIFLIATGLENQDDYLEFDSLLEYLSACCQKREHRPRIIFSATLLVRFPYTPLAFESGSNAVQYDAVLRRLQQIVALHEFEFRAAMDGLEAHVSQTLLRASNRTGAAIVAALLKTGFIYYRGIPVDFVKELERQLRAKGLAEAAPDAETVSGDFLKTGVDPGYLKRLHARNRVFEQEKDCFGRIGTEGKCRACGACADAAARSAITAQKKQYSISIDTISLRIKTRIDQQAALNFFVSLSEQSRGIARSYCAAALASALMQSEPSLADSYGGYKTTFWGAHRGSVWMHGDEVITLAWSREACADLIPRMIDPEFVAKVNVQFQRWGSLRAIVGAMPAIKEIQYGTPFHFDPAAFCKSLGIKYLLKKNGVDRRVYEITPAAQKKQIIRSITEELHAREAPGRVIVAPGKKFDPERFAQEAFCLPDQKEWIRIRMKGVLANAIAPASEATI